MTEQEILRRLEQHCGFSQNALQEDIWTYLQKQDRPIWLYGMGDGALKVMEAMGRYKLRPTGIFASDDFAREKIFCGYPIRRFSDVKAQYKPGEWIILLCFAAFREDLYPRILHIAKEQELYAPDVPVAYEGEHFELFTLEYVQKHADELTQVYDHLADEQSRMVFRDVLAFKLSGKPYYLDRCTTDMSEVYDTLICPQKTDVYVDLGAYNGDTATEFLEASGGSCARILALEPDARNYRKLCAQMDILRQTAGNTVLEPIHAGAHSAEGIMAFSASTGRSGRLKNGAKTVEVRVCAVDDLLAGSRADVIKLDVEGAEKQALEGCRKTIEAYRPRLMVSAYHRNEDLFALPLQILSMNPAYRVYLRHHRYIPAWETCYYFV